MQGSGSGNVVDASQMARLREMGEMLRRRREARGISIDDAVEATKVRGRYLQAIEDGDWSRLPDIVYARGFVRNYAEFLGIDGAEVTKLYLGVARDEEVQPAVVSPPRADKRKPEVARKPTGNAKGRKTPTTMATRAVVKRPAEPIRDRGGSGLLWKTAGVLALILVALLVYSNIGRLLGHSKSTSAIGTVKPVTGTVTPSTTGHSVTSHSGGTSPAKSGTNTQPSTPAVTLKEVSAGSTQATFGIRTKSPLTVVLTVTGASCWMRITADGQVVVASQTVAKGQTLTWHATQSLQVWAGQTQSIRLTVNGLPVPVTGTPQVYKFNFVKD